MPGVARGKQKKNNFEKKLGYPQVPMGFLKNKNDEN